MIYIYKYLALIRQCLERVLYMLPTALEYPSGMVSVWTGLLGEEGRGHFGGYKTIPNTFIYIDDFANMTLTTSILLKFASSLLSSTSNFAQGQLTVTILVKMFRDVLSL